MEFYNSKFGTGCTFGAALTVRVNMHDSRDYFQKCEDASYCLDAPENIPVPGILVFESEGKLFYSQQRTGRE